MINSKIQLLNAIQNCLTNLEAEVEKNTLTGLYDINKYAEYYIIPFLNAALNCKLKNLNDVEPNAKAIDLYDTDKKICVQVTSNKQYTTKIKKTITDFESSEYKSYEMYFYFLHTISSKERKIIKTKFNCEKNVLDASKLIQKYNSFNIPILSSLYEQVSTEINIAKELTNNNGIYSYSDYLINNAFASFPTHNAIETNEICTTLPIIKKIEIAFNKEKSICLYADEGRGKTYLSKIIAYNFYKKYFDVIVIDFLLLQSISKREQELLYIFCCRKKTLLILDNIHAIADNEILTKFKKLVSNNVAIQCKFLLCSRNTILAQEFDTSYRIGYSPNSKDVELIVNKKISKENQRILLKEIGRENCNLRFLSIFINNIRSYRTVINLQNVYTSFAQKFDKVLSPLQSFSKDILQQQLIALAKKSLIEIQSIELSLLSTDVREYFNKLYEEGYLLKRNKGYSFPHIYDSVAYLKGIYKKQYFDKVLEELVVYLEQIDIKNIDTAANNLYIILRDTNKYEEANYKTLEALRYWINNKKELSNLVFSKNIGSFIKYYTIRESLNKNNLEQTRKEIYNNFRDIVKDKIYKINITNNPPIQLEMLAALSKKVFKDFCLLELLKFTEKEIKEKYSLDKLQGLKRLKQFFYKNRIININASSINFLDESNRKENWIYIKSRDCIGSNESTKLTTQTLTELTSFTEAIDLKKKIKFININISRATHFFKYLHSYSKINEATKKNLVDAFTETICKCINEVIEKTKPHILVNLLAMYKLQYPTYYNKVIKLKEMKNQLIIFKENSKINEELKTALENLKSIKLNQNKTKAKSLY